MSGAYLSIPIYIWTNFGRGKLVGSLKKDGRLKYIIQIDYPNNKIGELIYIDFKECAILTDRSKILNILIES